MRWVLSWVSFRGGFPGGLDRKEICLQCRRPEFDPWVRKIPWRREWQPTPVFLPREFHGQRSLAGYSPWGHHKESDMTEGLTIFTFTSLRGEAQSHPRLHDLTFSSLPITETRARGPWCPQEDTPQQREGQRPLPRLTGRASFFPVLSLPGRDTAPCFNRPRGLFRLQHPKEDTKDGTAHGAQRLHHLCQKEQLS